MKPDILINNQSMNAFGWLRESIDFPTPKSQSEIITVPGRNTPIRYTEALGSISFQPRSFSITLSMLGTRMKYNRMLSEISNAVAGHLCKVICSEEPTLYAVGTLEVEAAYDPISGKGQVVLSCEDGDSYRYHVNKTVQTIKGSGQLVFENDFMPVVPEVTTTAETSLSWKVGSDTFRKTVSAGTWEFPEMEFASGRNTVTVSGTGDTTFTFREGRL